MIQSEGENSVSTVETVIGAQLIYQQANTARMICFYNTTLFDCFCLSTDISLKQPISFGLCCLMDIFKPFSPHTLDIGLQCFSYQTLVDLQSRVWVLMNV